LGLATDQNFRKPVLDAAAACGPSCNGNTVALQNHKTGLTDQVLSFFKGLFDTKYWPARWHCGSWSDFHGWLYIFSDLLIWASYFTIPVILINILVKRADIIPRVVWLFVAFIILCGTTHLIDAVIFWWPAYRLSALLRFVTGIVSVVTVFVLYKVMPSILTLRSFEELEKEINERKLVEEKLAASEFLLNEAGRIGKVGGWEIDVKTRKRTWSKTVYDIFELPYDFVGDDEQIISFFIEPYRQKLIDALLSAYKNGTGWDLELQMITAKGHNIWVRSRGEAFYNKAGELVNLRGVFMDIDRYKVNERALIQAHEMLTGSHKQLKTFTHILSHNLRNHASNITLLIELINYDALDAGNFDLLTKISTISSGLNGTLNDLSEAIKIRESTVKKETLTFREVAESVVEVLQPEIDANNATIEFSFDVETVNYPKLYLESILMNLLSNSIKYKKEDTPVLITLRTYLDEENRTVLECSDNGQGIDLALHGEKIFGLYKTFHVHKNAHGVGLFLVKTQVESQGGIISVESFPGEGTVFKIKF
jgi:signal transduction histidine kinase